MFENKKIRINLLTTYRNYLFAIQERKEYGDKYGDTDEIIQIYERKLQEYGVKVIKKDNKW